MPGNSGRTAVDLETWLFDLLTDSIKWPDACFAWSRVACLPYVLVSGYWKLVLCDVPVQTNALGSRHLLTLGILFRTEVQHVH